MRLIRLDGRGFVVLGGGQGLGRQSCHALAQAGALVACVDIDQARAEAVASEVGGMALAGDITKRRDVEGFFAAATERLGPVRGVVDVVGMAVQRGPLHELDDAAWSRQFDLVLTHAFLAASIGGQLIAANGGGSMVFIASIGGSTQVPGLVAYNCAKGALIRLVAGMASELGPKGVRINAVSPGLVRTHRAEATTTADAWKKMATIPALGGVAQASEIASAVLFLAGDLASHVTGHNLVVDGGISGFWRVPD